LDETNAEVMVFTVERPRDLLEVVFAIITSDWLYVRQSIVDGRDIFTIWNFTVDFHWSFSILAETIE
jgi:hypothetical protein